jgi:uncharacterized protein YceK
MKRVLAVLAILALSGCMTVCTCTLTIPPQCQCGGQR